MDVFTFVSYLLIFVIFAVSLRGYISVNQVQRQKFYVVETVFAVIFLGVFFVAMFRGDENFMLYMFGFTAFDFIAPQVIAYFVNLQRVNLQKIKSKKTVFQLRASASQIAVSVLGIVFMALFIVFFLKSRIIGGKPLYDAKYFRSEISIWTFSLAYIILFVKVIIQKTTIYSKGVLHQSALWEWSDFESFVWESDPKKRDIYELWLITANPSWFIADQVMLKIPAKMKERVDVFISQKLRKEKDSE